MLALNVNIPFSHWLVLTVNLSGDMPVPATACHTIQRSDDQSGRCIRYVAGRQQLSYSVQTGYAGGGDGNSGSTATPR